MSSVTYPGLPTVARQYWQAYANTVVAIGLVLLFTGAAGALAILTFLPAAKWYFAIAAAGLIVHAAALFIRDVARGEYDPSQTTFSTASQLLVVVVLVGVFQSTILFFGAVSGYLLATTLGWPVIVAAGAAAYYPVLDLVLMRREWYTPGALAFVAVTLAAATLFNIHQSVLDAIPLVGKRRRPQS